MEKTAIVMFILAITYFIFDFFSETMQKRMNEKKAEENKKKSIAYYCLPLILASTRALLVAIFFAPFIINYKWSGAVGILTVAAAASAFNTFRTRNKLRNLITPSLFAKEGGEKMVEVKLNELFGKKRVAEMIFFLTGFLSCLLAALVSIKFSSVAVFIVAYVSISPIVITIVSLIFLAVAVFIFYRKYGDSTFPMPIVSTQKEERNNQAEENFPEFLKFPWDTYKNDLEKEPTEEEMKKFFTPEVISQRMIFCPEINVDSTDDWGIFGYEPGFIFIQGAQNKGIHCLNDLAWAKGTSLKMAGASIFILSHYDFFPRNKFSNVLITSSRHKKIYDFLKEELGKMPFLEDKEK